MEILATLILIICSVLYIALFVKVWRACDDIRDLADKFAPEAKEHRLRTKESKDDAIDRAFIEDN